MKTHALTPFILFAFAVAMPACLQDESTSTGASRASLISPPAACVSGIPTCYSTADLRVQADLTTANSQNVLFSATDGALTLQAGSGNLVDTDGDGVPDPADECVGPGWRLPCDGDPSDDGIYQTLYFNSDTDITVRTDIDITGTIESADAYILMDATGSMGGEQVELVNGLTSGTLVTDPVACPGGVGTGLIGALRCAVPNRGSCPSTPAGRWGYPCFRPTTLPIIVLISDADMWNGPVNNGHTYGDPPFNGTLGLGTRLPPVEQSPNVLYSGDPFTAWDLGDLTNRSMTIMGSNTNLGNDAQTWDKGGMPSV